MSVFDTINKKHKAIEDLEMVHTRLQSKVKLFEGMQHDIQKALEMEKYLRALKQLNTSNDLATQNSIESALDDLAYDDLMEISKNALNIINTNGRNLSSINQLFNREHRAFIRKNSSADDIFEEELFGILKAIEQKAIKSETYDLGISLTGGQMTNIRKFSNMDKDILDNYLQEIFHDLVDNQGWSKKRAVQELKIAKLKMVSGKVDLQGFKADIDFEAELDPKWQKIVSAFSGANFTLKNYSSRTQIMELHLGKSSPYRAISGALDDLGFSNKDSDHIYFHARNSYYKHHSEKLARHLYHTRLYYELTGVGLYDSNGDPISSANFIIYNDPFTEDIFVRSTKKILYDLIFDNDDFSGDPYKAITIKKSYFI